MSQNLAEHLNSEPEIGKTYLANHFQTNGEVAESALDHAYCSESIENEVLTEKLKTSSTDHVPVIVSLKQNSVAKQTYTKKITKRSFKNFNYVSWNDALSKQDWPSVKKEPDLNKAAKLFSDLIDTALDEVAPVKSFTVKSNYKFGLSEKTKNLIKKSMIRKRCSTLAVQRKQ